MRLEPLLGAALLFSSATAAAQGAPGDQSRQAAEPPKTKVEAFQARAGSVIVRGFDEIGIVAGDDGSHVAVEAREFTDAASGRKEFGIAIRVRDARGIERTSYVDYDEIESLAKGLEYIEKIDQSVTRLRNFQADYRTRGDLRVSTFSVGPSRRVAVESGDLVKSSAYLPFAQLATLRLYVTAAKVKLDSIRPAAGRVSKPGAT